MLGDVGPGDGSSPHTRGAPHWVGTLAFPKRIIPAYAGSTGPWTLRLSRPDHPRIRGEHAIHRRRAVCRDGSSPHTRGAPPHPPRRSRRARIIPAYAGSTSCRRRARRRTADHPRIRGEHPPASIRYPEGRGSSPHTRGAPSVFLSLKVCIGIIPAYAGSTQSGRRGHAAVSDHPRIRGEHRRSPCRWRSCPGSSPHTRGALVDDDRAGHGGGIIPAYAGSTPLCQAHRRHFADHPRIRGEHTFTAADAACHIGSSPHTRGAPDRVASVMAHAGIIPAYAGSTAHREGGGPGRGDHPRIRGEHPPQRHHRRSEGGSSPHTRGARPDPAGGRRQARIIPAYAGSTARGFPYARCFLGSSPHTRGALRPIRWMGRRWRIIPAYAGSTRSRVKVRPPVRDHPRIRGEHSARSQTTATTSGSSPHTRGALGDLLIDLLDDRIIPAYAGSTHHRQPRGGWKADHPRIRGEHHMSVGHLPSTTGSSPHTRGARTDCGSLLLGCGIIPAYAGSTRTCAADGPPARDHPRIRGEHVS